MMRLTGWWSHAINKSKSISKWTSEHHQDNSPFWPIFNLATSYVLSMANTCAFICLCQTTNSSRLMIQNVVPFVEKLSVKARKIFLYQAIKMFLKAAAFCTSVLTWSVSACPTKALDKCNLKSCYGYNSKAKRMLINISTTLTSRYVCCCTIKIVPNLCSVHVSVQQDDWLSYFSVWALIDSLWSGTFACRFWFIIIWIPCLPLNVPGHSHGLQSPNDCSQHDNAPCHKAKKVIWTWFH